MTTAAAETRELVLSIQDLTINLTRGRRRWPVVGNVSLDVAAGEIVGLVGESGSGKTTVCRFVAGLLHEGMQVESGRIFLAGRETTSLSAWELHRLRPRGLSMVFQDPLAALNPVIRIGDQVREAVTAKGQVSGQDAEKVAVDLLQQVGLSNAAARMHAYPSELSGGQRQRVMIATAMATDPVLLLADEPTSALDVSTQAEILELLRTLAHDRGLSILLVSHDYAVVSELCTRVCVMYAGRLVESGLTDDILRSPGHPYTAGLIASLPSIEQRQERLPVIPGRTPSPQEMLAGCPFLPRCSFAVPATCTTAPMSLERVPQGETHLSACVRLTSPDAVGLEVLDR